MTGSLKLPQAERLADQLCRALDDRDIEIDATAVDEVDASILQVLVAARREASAKGRSFEVSFDPEGAPQQLAAQLYLTAALGMTARAGSSNFQGDEQ